MPGKGVDKSELDCLNKGESPVAFCNKTSNHDQAPETIDFAGAGRSPSMFKGEGGRYTFKWEDLGNIGEGRANLGPNSPVWAYRLMQFTLRDVLVTRFGEQAAEEIFVEAGRVAGMEFCRNMLNPGLAFEEFISHLQHTLQEQKIDILRIEKSDLETLRFTLAIAEDLDCSGLPFTDEVVCQYDEGFIAGIFECYTGKPFQAKEIDCWASGDRVCRFDVGRARETI